MLTCAVCSEPEARWNIQHARYGRADICSLCFLYDSGWLDQRESLQAFEETVCAVGLRRNQVLKKVAGRLVRVRDADDVLGGLTIRERIARFKWSPT
jgi:hypothetical protein